MTPDDETLIIDPLAAARPDPAALAEWLNEQRVFVSSVMDDYADVRSATVNAIRDAGATPVYFEDFGGRDADPSAAYLPEVRSSDIYVGLLGARYGRPLPSRYSATHEEYLEAERAGLRLSIWVQSGVEREGPQQSFVDAVRVFDVTGGFDAPADLRQALRRRLDAIAAEEISPWVKLGPVAFRAQSIVDDGHEAVVTARVRDSRIVEWLRGTQSSRGRAAVPFTYSGRTAIAKLGSVRVTSAASRSVSVDVTLTLSARPKPNAYSFNGVSWDDATVTALGMALFGDESPFGRFGPDLDLRSPFPLLARAQVAEEALRPLARLLLTEELILRRGITRLEVFRIGREINGRRHVRARFTGTQQYVNQPSGVYEIEGDAQVS